MLLKFEGWNEDRKWESFKERDTGEMTPVRLAMIDRSDRDRVLDFCINGKNGGRAVMRREDHAGFAARLKRNYSDVLEDSRGGFYILMTNGEGDETKYFMRSWDYEKAKMAMSFYPVAS